ncbi:MAG: cupin domain-containing protein [Thermomicrobiales bacterium]
MTTPSDGPSFGVPFGRLSRRRAVGTIATGSLTAGIAAGLIARPDPAARAQEAPPSTQLNADGTTPFNLRLAESIPETYAGGTFRTATVTEMPRLTGLSIHLVEIAPGAVREVHWHPNATEISYVLRGEGIISILSTSGDNAIFPVSEGTSTFVPQGDAHSVQNTGLDTLTLLIGFTSEDPVHISLSQAMPWVPTDVMNQTLGVPIGTIPPIPPRGDLAIVPMPDADPIPLETTETPYSTPLSALTARQFGGGTVQALNPDVVPKLAGMTLLRLVVDARAVREPHWHGNAAEFNYCARHGANRDRGPIGRGMDLHGERRRRRVHSHQLVPLHHEHRRRSAGDRRLLRCHRPEQDRPLDDGGVLPTGGLHSQPGSVARRLRGSAHRRNGRHRTSCPRGGSGYPPGGNSGSLTSIFRRVRQNNARLIAASRHGPSAHWHPTIHTNFIGYGVLLPRDVQGYACTCRVITATDSTRRHERMTATKTRPGSTIPFRTISPWVVEIRNTSRRRVIGAGAGAALIATTGGRIAAQGTPSASPISGSRTITTDLGTYEIPVHPKRVIAIDARTDLETALVLGLPVIGTSLRQPNPWVPAPQDITIIDGPIDFEQVAALEPDLIICANENDEWWPTEKLQQFAPVIPTSFETYWKDDLDRVASWLGRTEQLDEGLGEYDAAIAESKAAHADALASKKVAYLQYIPDTMTFAVNTEGRLQPQVLQDLGGSLFGELRPYTTEAEISMERIGTFADADGFFLQDTEDHAALNALAEQPLWTGLPAVQAGHVVTSRGNVNYGGIYTAQEITRNWSELFATFS